MLGVFSIYTASAWISQNIKSNKLRFNSSWQDIDELQQLYQSRNAQTNYGMLDILSTEFIWNER